MEQLCSSGKGHHDSGRGSRFTSTVLTNSSTVVGGSTPPLFVLTDGGTNSIPRRMTGIGFKGALINSNFNKAGIAVADNGWYSQKRVDHCQFDDLYCAIYTADSTGVTDHNLIRNVSVPFRHVGNGSQHIYAWDNFRPLAFDSLNYMFHEDETIEISGDALVADEVESCSWVIRYCDITCKSADDFFILLPRLTRWLIVTATIPHLSNTVRSQRCFTKTP